MSNVSMTPGSRPRKGVIAALTGVAAVSVVAAVVIAGDDLASRLPGSPVDPPVAGAAELDTFASCADMEEWVARTARAEERMFGVAGATDDRVVADAAPAADEAAATEADAAGDGVGGTGSTNVAVEGVDEVDLVERIDDSRALVVAGPTLALVDLEGAEVLSRVTVPWDAEITHDAERGVVWAVGGDDQGNVSVERIAVTDDGLERQGEWTTPGSVVAARRVAGELHLVATDRFDLVVEEPGPGVDPAGPRPWDARSLPFSGEPVPCDEVLHIEGPGTPSATLIVTFPAAGDVAPVRAAEVVGSGQGVHLTPDAAYVTTPTWSDDGTHTGIHRFDLTTLEATGSGVVEGTLLDDFALSEHDGVLRVATTVGPSWGPVPIEGPADVAPPPEGGVLNEIVVLDTDGALDEIGRTERFGKPGETIHGIRFSGTTGYAVTFLETDPFYVIDLTNPTSPEVVGEVELPGFSAYLHPLDDSTVVGFGPGEDGRASAKLFDVSDPTSPTVVDDLTLGDDSPVAWDHHAFADLGDGRFAVPATAWSSGANRVEVVVVDASGGSLAVEQRWGIVDDEQAVRVLPTPDGWGLLTWSDLVLLTGDDEVAATIGLAP